MVTASVRLAAPSFVMIAETWNLAVCSLIDRRAAISLLGSPSAMSCNTSRSRGVRGSSAPAASSVGAGQRGDTGVRERVPEEDHHVGASERDKRYAPSHTGAPTGRPVH